MKQDTPIWLMAILAFFGYFMYLAFSPEKSSEASSQTAQNEVPSQIGLSKTGRTPSAIASNVIDSVVSSPSAEGGGYTSSILNTLGSANTSQDTNQQAVDTLKKMLETQLAENPLGK